MVVTDRLAESHARIDAAATLFRQYEWVLPPYFVLGFLTRVADRVRAASDPWQQLEVELKDIYDADYLAAMLRERYPGVLDVRDFVPSIGEAFESAALRCWRAAITALLTTIEGILRQAAPRIGATAGQGTNWLPAAIDTLIQRISNAAQLDGHGETDEQFLASVRRADDERKMMLVGFRDFARDFLLDRTSRYSGQTGLNRHAILHGIDSSSYAKPGNFYRLVTLLDILCHVLTFDTPDAPMLAPEDTPRSQELAAYYKALTAITAHRPVATADRAAAELDYDGAGDRAAVEPDYDGAEQAPQSTLVEMDSPDVRDLRSADIHANQHLIASLSAKNQALLEMNRELETKIHERTHELAAANARLAELAVTDGLTGLYNPRYFHEQLATEVERSQRSGLALSLLMLDVDHFKQFNDTFGHPAGDEVLRQLACLLSDARRDRDVVARYGGEEFAVIMVDTTKFTAAEIAEQIRERVFAHDFSGAAQRAGRIGVSIGVATFLDDGGDAEALVRAADTALYAAKRAGRNRVVLATETLLAAPR